ncbi:serine/threonine protein kinase [Blastomyces gilchristii SLH14081]|uniref:Serine/threonine protein kinase n=1 Tax=Blastomyces gilchristii (strain SLH14081) TaxID=559298 RepID=A0A179UF47_BLAGS|nr:serine/threonine protein kinase [Blastomyces gilchristii SLH14081]OAT05621.1 serine/threonine protein kinase [Blastomyces gilchristii SLH14081]
MSNKEPPIPLALKTSVDPSASLLSPLNPSSALTPPLTPITPTDIQESSGGQRTQDRQLPGQKASDDGKIEGQQTKLPKQPLLPLEFTYDLEFQRDSGGNLIEYGSGVWSVVYSATSRWIPTTQDSPLTPPPPQQHVSTSSSTPNLAVKVPVRQDAHSILRAEARLLSRLCRIPGAEHYVVPFHGFISASHSLVLSALPLSLSAYISSQAVSARQVFSTKTMFDPVLGMPRWLTLARALVRGLEWLHSCGHIVHGDIKPQNILLRPLRKLASDCAKEDEDPFPYEPLHVDFTSSYDPSTPIEPSPQGPSPWLSALTPPFAAPELLTVQSLKATDVVQSKASDVFSLAVTLLAAVTGDLLLYPGSSNMQRLAMSREGHLVLDHVRSGVHGSRLPLGGVVEKILSPAVVKDPETRIKPTDWLRIIDDCMVAEGLQK